ncbi:hypothetical protein AB0I10_12545 [Streptomyces sp. NPDC050636]|uniref:hypothetical protein n=1 Tax=Streptomyces sp. NPDC050636 TaxID=3154510 RepID=UPI00343A0927
MSDPAVTVAAIRTNYGPEEERALAAYGDLITALTGAGLHPYVETRGGLAVCALTEDGSVIAVASGDALPLDRARLMGWHVTHVPEDDVAPSWRCRILDTTPTDPADENPGNLALIPVTTAVKAHLVSCPHFHPRAAA